MLPFPCSSATCRKGEWNTSLGGAGGGGAGSHAEGCWNSEMRFGGPVTVRSGMYRALGAVGELTQVQQEAR